MTDPRIAVLSALSSPSWHPVPEAHGMPWDEAEQLLAAYDASRPAAVPSAPADADPAETDEQRADREETEREHAHGDHTYCGVTCEAEFPSESMRNAILARAIPGSKGMLDELLRRAREEARRG